MTDNGDQEESAAQARIAYNIILNAFDRQTTLLFEAVRTDERLEEDTVRTVSRHLRKVRAELESARLEFDTGDEQIADGARFGYHHSVDETFLHPDLATSDLTHGGEDDV
jgi:hypothetical protein